MRTNFHTHTTASDGSLTPTGLVERFKGEGVEALAVTDHDTVGGVEEAKAACERLGIAFVAGIELSSYSTGEIHILGYNMDYKAEGFVAGLEDARRRRRERNEQVIANLAALGMPINTEEFDVTNDNLGRLHLAKQMVKQGYVENVNEAFDKFLANGKPAHSAGNRLKPLEAVRLIKTYGGIAVLAHPLRLYNEHKLDYLLDGLKPYGLDGMECYYPTHTADDTRYFVSLAKKKGLLALGGTDFHFEGSYCNPGYRNDLIDVRTLRALGVIN